MTHPSEFIEHTLLRPDAGEADIFKHCEEALRHRFRAVCAQPVHLQHVVERLRVSDVLPVTVIGFPHGATTSDTKEFEARRAVDTGARELDMVIAIGALKDGDDIAVARDIRKIVGVGVPVKVILETGYLNEDEIIRACVIAVDSGAAFVKTATGFGPGGATVEAVRLMRQSVGDRAGVKAAGGIRDWPTMKAMLDAGANRIGTSSGPAIVASFLASADHTHEK